MMKDVRATINLDIVQKMLAFASDDSERRNLYRTVHVHPIEKKGVVYVATDASCIGFYLDADSSASKAFTLQPPEQWKKQFPVLKQPNDHHLLTIAGNDASVAEYRRESIQGMPSNFLSEPIFHKGQDFPGEWWAFLPDWTNMEMVNCSSFHLGHLNKLGFGRSAKNLKDHLFPVNIFRTMNQGEDEHKNIHWAWSSVEPNLILGVMSCWDGKDPSPFADAKKTLWNLPSVGSFKQRGKKNG